MPDVSYHGWTHRPKAQGGTDPIELHDMPFAYATVSGFDADNESEYSLFAGDDEGFVGNALGCAGNIYIQNVGGTDTFTLDDTQLCLLVNEPGLYAFDACVLWAGGFDGVIEAYPDTSFNIWDRVATYNTLAHWPMKEWRVVTDSDDHDASVRISGVVLLQTGASEDFFSVIVQQRSGETQTIQQGWALVTKLSDAPTGAIPSVYPV